MVTRHKSERKNRNLGEREMFYLTTHSTHFIYGYMASDIWLRTILIVRKETCCRHIGYSYRLTQGFFYMHHPTDRITHTTAFVTPVVEHWLEREIAQWIHPMKDRSENMNIVISALTLKKSKIQKCKLPPEFPPLLLNQNVKMSYMIQYGGLLF